MEDITKIDAALAATDAAMAAKEQHREAIKQELRALEQNRNRLLAMRELLAKSPAAREALVLAAKSIASGEAIGIPGK